MKSKILTIFYLLFFASHALFAQIFQPVKWSFKSEHVNAQEEIIILTATIDKGWHLYSQFIGNDGPIPTSITFEKSKDFELMGSATEGKAIEEYDKNFDMILKFFANKAEFKQRIKIKSKKDFTVKGSVNFMVCDDSKCLPPEDVEFAVSVKTNNNEIKGDNQEPTLKENETGENKSEANPTSIDETLVPEKSAVNDSSNKKQIEKVNKIILPKEESKSSLGIFIAGFLGGLLALLTPCVFPMIPLTVSFFTKKSGNKKKGIINALDRKSVV